MDVLSLPVNATCPIAHALDALGEKWTLLILREAFAGRTRFAEFQRIGIPREALSQRLARLVDEGVLAKRPYKEAGSRMRDEYVLTDGGRDVSTVLAALYTWGLRHREEAQDQGVRFHDRTSGRPLTLAFHDGERRVGTAAVELVRTAEAAPPAE
jgi:DNA-binding HxlR family transcriptional regulator